MVKYYLSNPWIKGEHDSLKSALKSCYGLMKSFDFGPHYEHVFDSKDMRTKNIVGTVVGNCIYDREKKRYVYFAVYVPEGHISDSRYIKWDGTFNGKVTKSESMRMEYPLNWRTAMREM